MDVQLSLTLLHDFIFVHVNNLNVEKVLSNLMIAANLKVIMPSYKPISRCQCSIKQFQ